MKKIAVFTLAVASMMTLSCCNGQTQKTQEEAETVDAISVEGIEGVSTVVLNDGSQAFWLQDNEQERKNPTTLFGEVPQEIIDSLGVQDGIPSSMSTVLLKSEGKWILFDSGLGANGHGQLQNRLQALGLTPADIDFVYITHFHGDHIGGMLDGDSIVFNNAQVYASQAEYDGWMNMPADKNGQQVKVMEAYKDQLHLFTFDQELPCGIVALDAVGHTPGHAAYLKSNLLVVGDLFHGWALQEKHTEFCANFDMDKAASVASRQRLMEYARTNGLYMAGMHLPAPGFFE